MKRAVFCLIASLAVFAQGVSAWGRQVPEVLLFQSSLYDDGGNPVPDGPVDLMMRVLDEAGGVLYEERQTPDAIRGQISVLLGNGISASGAPTGGIPSSVLDTEEARYIEAEVAGQPSSVPMEIASVPYALYANEANRVAEGGVGFEALEADLFGRLVETLSDSAAGDDEVLVRGDLPTMYSEGSAAASIGVEPSFSYSSSGNLQGVLADFDAAIGVRDSRITSEVSARQQGDSSLSASVAAEAVARQEADAAITQRLNAIDPSVTQPPVPQFHPNAWGRVIACQNVPVAASLANASASSWGATQCRISFSQPMQSADYAIITAPYAVTVDREAGGFKVNCGSLPNCGFEFIVMGR